MKLERYGPLNDTRIQNKEAFIYLVDGVEVDYATFKSINKARRPEDELIIEKNLDPQLHLELLGGKPEVNTDKAINPDLVRAKIAAKAAKKTKPAAPEGK